MKISSQMLKINRNFVLCFIASAAVSSAVAQMMAGYESHINTSITILAGYAAFFGVFITALYKDNRIRYRQMDRGSVRKELAKIASSMSVGEIIYLAVRWLSMYYFLEYGMEPYMASLASETLAFLVYIFAVSAILKAVKAFQ